MSELGFEIQDSTLFGNDIAKYLNEQYCFENPGYFFGCNPNVETYGIDFGIRSLISRDFILEVLNKFLISKRNENDIESIISAKDLLKSSLEKTQKKGLLSIGFCETEADYILSIMDCNKFSDYISKYYNVLQEREMNDISTDADTSKFFEKVMKNRKIVKAFYQINEKLSQEEIDINSLLDKKEEVEKFFNHE